ncbi:MAG TPA: LUD domain-containing protein [Clostridiales bacterium]|nr:LUD domain-containing protein [Clostridiales bacterium]
MNIEKTIENLEKRGFQVARFKTRQEAADYLVESIKGTTVGIGGSVTVEQLDVYDRLCENNTVFWQWRNHNPETIMSAAKARVYITSANAVAETGEIINIDGRGNRVASTLHDKDAVYIVIGTNKIEESFDAAMWRAKNVAAPKNAQRLKKKTPCAVKGDKCYDCNSPERICRGLVVLWKRMLGVSKIEVVIVEEDLGL